LLRKIIHELPIVCPQRGGVLRQVAASGPRVGAITNSKEPRAATACSAAKAGLSRLLW
jgi:hypothetical protein